MADPSDDAKDIEKLYEFGERLSEAKNKSQLSTDYEGIIKAAQGSIKAKQLAAQLIPRFFKYFPDLWVSALDALFDLCEHEELGVRVQAIRGLPLLCKDSTEFVSKVIDVVAQMLNTEENMERDAVQKALLSLLRQDVKASLTALFKYVECADEGTDENFREKVLTFIKDKVFSIKAELLKPQEQMERHITNLIKKSLRDVNGAEFKMFMDFLNSLSIFGDKAPIERVQELLEIIEDQADLYVEFDISDGDHLQRILVCFHMAIPFFRRGASNSKFFNYVKVNLIPVFDKLPEGQKLDLLKGLAESSPYTATQDSRQILPSIVELLKKLMPRIKEETNLNFTECLLYTFHHLAAKAPNATNSLCGYKIVTGQPSDRIGEDFSEQYKDFMERLTCIEELARASMKKLTQGMAELNKAFGSAVSDEGKEKIKLQKQNATNGLRTCNNILAMTQPLHAKTPSFIGNKKISLSWQEPAKPTSTSGPGAKRSASVPANGSNNGPSKRGRGRGGGFQNQLVNRALESASYGGRGGFRGRGRGRGWYGRGRGPRGRGSW